MSPRDHPEAGREAELPEPGPWEPPPTRCCLDQGTGASSPAFLWGVGGCHAPVPPSSLTPWCPGEPGTSPLRRVVRSPLGLRGGVIGLQDFGSIWRKKEPNAQKPRLNKACRGRAAVWAAGAGRCEGAGAAWLLHYRRPASGPGRDSEGALCSPDTRARPPLTRGGLCTCMKGSIFPSPTEWLLPGSGLGPQGPAGTKKSVTSMSSSREVQRDSRCEESTLCHQKTNLPSCKEGKLRPEGARLKTQLLAHSVCPGSRPVTVVPTAAWPPLPHARVHQDAEHRGGPSEGGV